MADMIVQRARFAAASAGSASVWLIVHQTFLWQGWSWLYESTEANADNTLDFVISFGVSATFTNLFANGNANGLLDTSAILTPNTKMGNAASGGATAIAVTVVNYGVTPTAAQAAETRVAAGNTLRTVSTTAGTGTVPGLSIDSFGTYV